MKCWRWLVAIVVLAVAVVGCKARTPTTAEYFKAYRSTTEAWLARLQQVESQPMPDKSLPRPQRLERLAAGMDRMAAVCEDGAKQLQALRYPPRCKEMNDATIDYLTMLAGSFRQDASTIRAGRRLGSDAQLRADMSKALERLIQAEGRAGMSKLEMDRLRALSAEMLRQ